MQNARKTKKSINLIVLIVIVMICSLLIRSNVYATTEAIPRDDQYLELRATTINEVEGQGKQVIMELWGHEMDFKRFCSSF